MFRRNFGFGLVVSVLWGCVASDEPCPDCRQTLENGPAPYRAPRPARGGFCGDGVWDPASEECDDGSACRDGRDCTGDRLRCESTSDNACQPRSRDGCSDQCTVEPGFACPDGRHCSPLAPDAAPPAVAAGAANGVADAGAPFASGDPVTPPGAGPGRCRDPRFAAPERVTGLDTELDLWAPSLSSDGRTLFCAANTQSTPERIFFATRNGRGTEFSRLAPLARFDSGFGDGTPVLAFDGLTLYFYSRRPGGSGDRDLWYATRGDPAGAFGAPKPFGAVNGPSLDHLPWLSADELTLLFVSTRAGGLGQSDLWLARRASRADEFGEPELFRSLSSSADEGRAVVSRDGSFAIFASARAGGQGSQDLWLATRAGDEQEDQGFSAPTNLANLNSPSLDVDPFLSADERELFFSSNRAGRTEIFRARIECDD